VEVEVLAQGQGKTARAGQHVLVRYAGRLARGGKQFDAGTIKFLLGRGEVIQGWDVGVAGMAVREKRRLHVPAPMGYGARGAPPDIPKHAALLFDVELMKIL